MSDGVEDRATSHGIAEGAPFDHQRAFGLVVKVTCLVQQIASGHSGQLLSGQERERAQSKWAPART